MKLDKKLLKIYEKANAERINYVMSLVKKRAIKGKNVLVISNKRKKTRKAFRLFIDREDYINHMAVYLFIEYGFEVTVGNTQVTLRWCDIEIDDGEDDCSCGC